MTDITPTIKKLIANEHCSEKETYRLFKNFIEAPLTQQAAILTLFSSKEITVPELIGALRYFLEQSSAIDCSYPVIDVVGTGGDGLGTFNISTASSIVVASCGVYVAKHGGRASTSLSGSMDVAECLGFPLFKSSSQILAELAKHHYVYVGGPFFNPLLKALRPLRKSLGFQTILNILSPLANPLNPKRIVIGVYRKDLVPKIAHVLHAFGKEKALVVCSDEGLDELSVSSQNYVAELTEKGEIKEYSITPEEVGLKRSYLSEVKGGTPQENAELIKKIFKGEEKGPKLDIVLFNAASGLMVAGLATDLREGVKLAKEAIDSKKTYDLLKNLQKA